MDSLEEVTIFDDNHFMLICPWCNKQSKLVPGKLKWQQNSTEYDGNFNRLMLGCDHCIFESELDREYF